MHPRPAFAWKRNSLTTGGGLERWAAWGARRGGAGAGWPPPWFPPPSGNDPSRPSHPADEGLRDARLQRLEAVLFLAREPLNSRKLSQYANLADGTEARTLIRRLNQLYDDCGRAFRVEEVAGGFRLMTRPKFGSWLRRLAQVPSEVRLSAPALETLAVIAYRQPAPRAVIEAIRGVNCGEVLRQLMERDLVRIVGRSDELGRPYLYGPTRRFLEVFGLRSLDDLPRVEALPGEEPPTDSPRDPSLADRNMTSPATPSLLPEENQTVIIQDLTEERAPGRWRLESGARGVPVGADEEEFEEEFDDEYEEDLEDDELEEEELDDEDLEEEEWEYEDEEEGEFEDEYEEDEWEELEEEEDEDYDEDEDWDEEDEEDEEWEDD